MCRPDGTHTYQAGRTLAEAIQADGHSNNAKTSIWPHYSVEDNGEIGAVFASRIPLLLDSEFAV